MTPSPSFGTSSLLVALGGGLGTALRYGVGRWAIAVLGPGFPFGTFAVNIIGGFLMGLLAGWLARMSTGNTGGAEELRLLLGVGVLGGFTTFSAFSLQTLRLIQEGDWARVAGNVLLSVGLGLFAAALGYRLARGLAG